MQTAQEYHCNNDNKDNKDNKDNDYIHDYDNDNVIVNKNSASQTPFTESLKILRDSIEALPVFHQTEVLRILYKNHITFSENKNGVFLNLSYVNLDVIHKINKRVKCVNLRRKKCHFLINISNNIANNISNNIKRIRRINIIISTIYYLLLRWFIAFYIK